MDEFNENNFFEDDNKAMPLEEKTEASDDAEITDTEHFADDVFTNEPEEQTGNDVFTFDENGEYHFTSPLPEEDIPAEDRYEIPEPEVETADEAHKNFNPYAQQNPYRNPYQQSGTYRGTPNYNAYSGIKPEYRQSAPQPAPPTKSSSKGKKVAAFLLAVIIIFGSIGVGISIGRSSKTPTASVSPSGQTDSNTTTTGESVTMNIAPSSQTPTQAAVNNVSPGIDVAKKARGSVVGVVVYDANGKLQGEGSGVVMGLNDARNLTYIITCAHVISDANIKSCGIMLEDRTIYQAKIVGYDERTDIGVLSVSQTNLQAATFGDSNALQVGETVYAIGNPGGSEFYGSMTSGIVSALDRSISSTYTMSVIQHNAAISPGNSGGALVNSEGQVVGINSSKISATDYEGIGFAVPVSVAQPIVEDLIKYGYVPNRPKLGISYASVSNYWRYSAIVQSRGLPNGSIIIASISDDSSFKGTDVVVGDMITSVNGKKLDKSDVLLDFVDKSNVGDTLKLGICRIERANSVGGSYTIKQFEVNITLVEDKGSSASKDQEETTTQSFYDYYYGNGNGDNYSNFDDFFSQFFGN